MLNTLQLFGSKDWMTWPFSSGLVPALNVNFILASILRRIRLPEPPPPMVIPSPSLTVTPDTLPDIGKYPFLDVVS